VNGASSAGESLTISGRAERVCVARVFVAAVLGAEHPCGETAVLLAGELVANSVRHSGSSLPGQTITVTVTAEADGLLVEVTDRSGPGLPVLRHDDGQAEGGRGLQLVNALAGRWGCWQHGCHTTTWFELRAVGA
jgi:anti-sigma regulatory factor (Ser/Thr protein kinase)